MKTHPFNLALEILRGAISRLRRTGRSSAPSGPATERAKFDTGKWTLELLKHLEWRRFEELCAAYFEALGDTTSTTRTRADGGADIALVAAGTGSPSVIVHCKAWSAYRVGIKSVRELRAAMATAGVAEGVLVTPGRFTQDAEGVAAQEGITLVDGADLLDKLAALPPEQSRALLKLATQGDFLTPTCPSCSVKMIARQSTAGGRRFWGCPNYPRCKEICFGTGAG